MAAAGTGVLNRKSASARAYSMSTTTVMARESISALNSNRLTFAASSICGRGNGCAMMMPATP
jgi:hypothetical protein